MELNTIQQQGKWSEVSERINQNFYKVNAAIAALDRSTRKNKGYYATYDELTNIVPQGNMGDIAFIGTNYPYYIYKWNGDGWVNTFETGGAQYVDLANYYTRSDIDTMLSNNDEERGQMYQELSSKIAQEESNRINQDAAQKTYLEKVKERLESDLDSEIRRAITEETILSNAIDEESARARNAEDSLQMQIYDNASKIAELEQTLQVIDNLLLADGTIYEYLNASTLGMVMPENGDIAQINLNIRDYNSKRQGLYVSMMMELNTEAYEGGDIKVRLRLGNDVYGMVHTLSPDDMVNTSAFLLSFRAPYAELGDSNVLEIGNGTGDYIIATYITVCPYDVNNIRDILDAHEKRITNLERNGTGGGGGSVLPVDVNIISKLYLDQVIEGIIPPPTTEWVV